MIAKAGSVIGEIRNANEDCGDGVDRIESRWVMEKL